MHEKNCKSMNLRRVAILSIPEPLMSLTENLKRKVSLHTSPCLRVSIIPPEVYRRPSELHSNIDRSIPPLQIITTALHLTYHHLLPTTSFSPRFSKSTPKTASVSATHHPKDDDAAIGRGLTIVQPLTASLLLAPVIWKEANLFPMISFGH